MVVSCYLQAAILPNNLGSAIVSGDDKLQFCEVFAQWLDDWRSNKAGIFCLSKQTFDALVGTLRAHSQLISDKVHSGVVNIFNPCDKV